MAERPIGIRYRRGRTPCGPRVDEVAARARAIQRYPTRASITCVRSSFGRVTRERSRFIGAYDDAAVVDVNAVALSHTRSMNEAETVAR